MPISVTLVTIIFTCIVGFTNAVNFMSIDNVMIEIPGDVYVFMKKFPQRTASTLNYFHIPLKSRLLCKCLANLDSVIKCSNVKLAANMSSCKKQKARIEKQLKKGTLFFKKDRFLHSCYSKLREQFKLLQVHYRNFSSTAINLIEGEGQISEIKHTIRTINKKIEEYIKGNPAPLDEEDTDTDDTIEISFSDVSPSNHPALRYLYENEDIDVNCFDFLLQLDLECIQFAEYVDFQPFSEPFPYPSFFLAEFTLSCKLQQADHWRYPMNDFEFINVLPLFDHLKNTVTGNVSLYKNRVTEKLCFFKNIGRNEVQVQEEIYRLFSYADIPFVSSFYGYAQFHQSFFAIFEHSPHHVQSYNFSSISLKKQLIDQTLKSIKRMQLFCHYRDIVFSVIDESSIFLTDDFSLRFLPISHPNQKPTLIKSNSQTFNSLEDSYVFGRILNFLLAQINDDEIFINYWTTVDNFLLPSSTSRPSISEFPLKNKVEIFYASASHCPLIYVTERGKSLQSSTDEYGLVTVTINMSQFTNGIIRILEKSGCTRMQHFPLHVVGNFRNSQEINLRERQRYVFIRNCKTSHQLFVCGTFTKRICIPMKRFGNDRFIVSIVGFSNANYLVYFFTYDVIECHVNCRLDAVPRKANVANHSLMKNYAEDENVDEENFKNATSHFKTFLPSTYE